MVQSASMGANLFHMKNQFMWPVIRCHRARAHALILLQSLYAKTDCILYSSCRERIPMPNGSIGRTPETLMMGLWFSPRCARLLLVPEIHHKPCWLAGPLQLVRNDRIKNNRKYELAFQKMHEVRISKDWRRIHCCHKPPKHTLRSLAQHTMDHFFKWMSVALCIRRNQRYRLITELTLYTTLGLSLTVALLWNEQRVGHISCYIQIVCAVGGQSVRGPMQACTILHPCTHGTVTLHLTCLNQIDGHAFIEP